MISTRYLRYLMIAFIASVLLTGYDTLRGGDTDYLLVLVATLFGVFFMSLVVVRLPLFRDYYNNKDSLNPDIPHMQWPNRKAAPVMSFLISGLTFGLCLVIIGAKSWVLPACCAGFAAAVISLYHDPL